QDAAPFGVLELYGPLLDVRLRGEARRRMIPFAALGKPSDLVEGCFVVGLGLVIVVVIIGTILSTRRAKERFYDGLARRLKGKFMPAGLLRHPRIEFLMAGRPARIEFVPSGDASSGCTRLLLPI